MEADFDKWLAEHVKESVPVNDGELPAGTRVGEYRIVALLGRGGFANVYRANGRNGEAVAIKMGEFDKSVCREMYPSDISEETVTWYLREMAYRKRKAALPITTTADELFTRLGLMKGDCYTWAAALCFSRNPQQWSYRTTLKCSWNEGVEFGRPFLDTDKFEGNLFELMRQGVDFVMSHIAQSRGLRTESFQAPMRFELPREVVEEALVNALFHRDNMEGHVDGSASARIGAFRATEGCCQMAQGQPPYSGF